MSKDPAKERLMVAAKKKINEPWKTKDGQVVKLVDIIGALHQGSALLQRDTVFNEKVMAQPILVISYKRMAEILDLIKARYEMALQISMPTPKLEITHGKRRKKNG